MLLYLQSVFIGSLTQSELTIKGFFLFPGHKFKLLQTWDKQLYLLTFTITLVEATDAHETGSLPATLHP